MKRFAFAALAAAALFGSFAMNSINAADKTDGHGDHAAAAPVYRHIVLFKFKDDAPADKVKGIVDAFKALPGKLPAIQAFECGTNVSPENLNQGFTHIFTLTFKNKEALEKHYLHEPAHKEFGAMLGGVLDKALVVDYVTQ